MSFKISAKITGTEKLAKKLDEAVKIAERKIAESLKVAAILIESKTKKRIASQSAGGSVVRYSPRRNHTVSKPGDAPNTDSGSLINSYRHNVDEKELTAEVGSNLPYAVHLEFGTKNMDARPHLGPSFYEVAPKFGKKFSINFSALEVK